MTLPRLLTSWRVDASIGGNIEAWQTIPARQAQFKQIPPGVHPGLREAFRQSGIEKLYLHQAAAWEHLQAGENVVVVTGTASGKTLCYNLPVLDRLLKNPETRALYLFPTKALSQDQFQNLQGLLNLIENFPESLELQRVATKSGVDNEHKTSVILGVYDGDTPAGSRPAIRKSARLILSNPDMLHTGILPHHTTWSVFFQRLQFIVIDEMHIYRGVFGSHVANVIRRLKRVARFYGANPQFILTSATIANPVELAEGLIEAPVALVDQDWSARGQKSFLIYNPPIVNRDLGIRRSALQESVRLASDLQAEGVQTIIFGRSRRTVELILTYLRQKPLTPIPFSPLEGDRGIGDRDVSDSIRGYRSGYLPKQRREIELGLRGGKVRAVVATTALELGIDIGGMGASLLVGYPGSIAATWQQAGRAGRGEDPSLAVLVATADPLDQFLAHHPDYFFGRSPEAALINPDNLLILLDHLRCAAFELPFDAGDSFGRLPAERLREFLDFLEEQGVLHTSGGRYFWMADQYPAQNVSLRSASVAAVILQSWEDTGPVTIGQVDVASARWMVHPQAVYLHEGQTYLVDDLDLEANVARVRRAEVDYYTEPQNETTVQLVEKLAEGEARGSAKAFGEITVTTRVTGFRKIKWFTHEQLGLGEVDLPPTELQTTGYWLALNDATVAKLREEGLWRNDPIDYGRDWPRQRDLARARDGYRCQVCGTPEQGRAHDVHHKIPFRTFMQVSKASEGDGQSRVWMDWQAANRLDNLTTLCHPCHRRVETAVRVRSGLTGLAHALGHLAPLFLMCDSRDLGVNADPQSPLSGGRPTIVLYDQVPAGIGLSQRLYEMHGELMNQAYELVSTCECAEGCPSCVGPGGENGLGGKRETLAIISVLNGNLKGGG